MSLAVLKKVKLPLILLTILIAPLYVGEWVPLPIKEVSYALSLSMKSILEFVLPFIIFAFVFSCLSNLKQGAVLFVGLLVCCVFTSNFSALMFGYASGKVGLNLIQFSEAAVHLDKHLTPAWVFHLKKLVSNDIALMCGFITGMFFSIRPHATAGKIAARLNFLANAFLKRLFIPVLPLFILGFVFKLEYEQILQQSLKVYGPILVLIIISQWLYIGLWYVVASGFSLKRLGGYIKNVLPASLTGLSTISSAAAMPVLLVGTEKNLNDPNQARMLVPAIINIHTLGSAIGVPILSMATLLAFGYPLPSLSTYVAFAFYTAIAKFAVAAVPGGVIIVVGPVLEAHLGFSGDMVGLLTAVWLICDPFGTTANVTANGVFPILFSRLYNKMLRQNSETSVEPKQEQALSS